jgi:hypothetical protein
MNYLTEPGSKRQPTRDPILHVGTSQPAVPVEEWCAIEHTDQSNLRGPAEIFGHEGTQVRPSQPVNARSHRLPSLSPILLTEDGSLWEKQEQPGA